MSSKKKIKVKDIAKKFNLSSAKVITELKELGLKLDSPSEEIDSDLAELVHDHFTDFKKTEDKAAEALLKEQEKPKEEVPPVLDSKEIHIKPPIIVRNLAELLGKKPNEIVSALMSMNILASINQSVEPQAAKKICEKYGFTLLVDRREKEEHIKHGPEETKTPDEKIPEVEDNPENLVERPPVVTFLGHVDHGKTSLQDYIRKTNIAAKESGGITQHIGASVVNVHGKTITFIDTPGHEAFTAMRSRGANVTDIAILVVAADDGFMPQTIEALSHAKAAKVSVIVAINKMDLPGADPDKVNRQMQQHGLLSEEWGGEIGIVKVSAVTGLGINQLLERILLESEMLQLKADPKKPASAVVIEAQLEQGYGPTANILVRSGTLKKGDAILCGGHFGKVKTMINYKGEQVNEAGPSTPVKLVGLSGVPEAGAKLVCCASEKEARKIAEEIAGKDKIQEQLFQTKSGINLEDLFSKLEEGSRKKLNIIIKADVQGSIEAITDSLKKFPSDKISIDIIHSATGAISENDVLLASASDAIVIGFHVRVNPGVNTLAKEEKVEIRLYSIIYELIEDLKEALTGKLAPEAREIDLGNATILKIFSISKGPKICGCMVEKGLVRVGAKARVFRNNELIFNGSVQSLRRFQDDVKEVKSGLECGIRLDNFLDFQENDKIQIYDIEFKKVSL